MKCSDEQYVSNLIEINKRAGVDPEVIDLIAAYGRLCLQQGKEPKFYEEKTFFKTNKPTVKALIEKNPQLDKRSLSFLVSYAEMMRDSRLPFIFNRSHLAELLEIQEDKLKQLIAVKGKFYHSFFIPKSNGKRLITAPAEDLKTIQKKILREILERVPLHPAANGFKRHRSIVTNAGNHIGREIIVKIDLKDFFPSITEHRVKAIYLNLGYPDGVAEALAELSSYKGRLPMGGPTSPYLSNIAATRLDRRFTNLGKKLDFRYSRYADDLAFSSADKGLARHMPFFKKIIEEEGFEVNEEKVVIARKGGQQKITGVVVNKKVNVERKEYRRLRAVVNNCIKGDLEKEMRKWGANNLQHFENTLLGHIRFVKMVNSHKGEKLLADFKRIQWPV